MPPCIGEMFDVLRVVQEPFDDLLTLVCCFVVKEFADHVEWIEPPSEVPNPEDPQEQRKAWEAIPTSYADQAGVWPLKDE